MKSSVSRSARDAKPPALLTSAQRSIVAAHQSTNWRIELAFRSAREVLDRSKTRRAIARHLPNAPHLAEAVALRVLSRACHDAFTDRQAMSAGLAYWAIAAPPGRLAIAISTTTPKLDKRAWINLETA